ncbi:MAG: 50S ribosomal protein L32 [Spartobacteria bacterium]|nr:50S ribosomal protein L32 [Spartobacteria bacterium]
MAQPKRKTSKSKKRMRKSQLKREIIAASPCPECGAPRQPHRVCTACGMYKGRQVLTVDAD